MSELSLQHRYGPDSRCFGCGPANEQGLRIESHEVEAEAAGELRAVWQPLPHHAAFDDILNGGVIGTLLNCHSNWTAAVHLMHERGLAGARLRDVGLCDPTGSSSTPKSWWMASSPPPAAARSSPLAPGHPAFAGVAA